jgi:hypothetical protein
LIIDYVEIDGQRTNIGAGSTSFPGYFDIDSMGLLLGKNGAGKTRLLLNIAEVLTRGAPYKDQGHWTGKLSWNKVTHWSLCSSGFVEDDAVHRMARVLKILRRFRLGDIRGLDVVIDAGCLRLRQSYGLSSRIFFRFAGVSPDDLPTVHDEFRPLRVVNKNPDLIVLVDH